jgi:hypothetical protein
VTDHSQPRDTAWHSAALDRAATEGSSYAMAIAARRELGLDLLDDLPADAADDMIATCWASDYAIEFDDKTARLVPRNDHNGGPYPPHVRDVPQNIESIWRTMATLLKQPAAQARLHHLIYQRGGSGAREQAAAAIDAYLASAENWTRPGDGVQDLRTASRLARAIKDEPRAIAALDRLLNVAEHTLDQGVAPGVVLQALRHVAEEPLCPNRIGAILERSAVELSAVDDRDAALGLILGGADSQTAKADLWARRVDNYLQAASDADSEILRMASRRDALRIAEASGIHDLRERAAAALQSTRERQLELLRFKSTSMLYSELFDETRNYYSGGDTWQEALVSYGKAFPLSGHYESNLQFVHSLRALAPLTALMPTLIVDEDGLPFYEAVSDEEKIEYQLSTHETQTIAGNLRPLVAALHSIPERFGLPPTEELAAFLAQWPGMHKSALPTVVYALQRFWAGDSQGAAYTLAPRIETLVREMFRSVEQGIYMLQQTHKPGQFPGLGAMLDLLPTPYEVSPSRQRFLKTALTNPIGLNIRNRLAHGVNEYGDAGTAALLIHIALSLTTLRPRRKSSDDSSTDTPTPPDDATPTS